MYYPENVLCSKTELHLKSGSIITICVILGKLIMILGKNLNFLICKTDPGILTSLANS